MDIQASTIDLFRTLDCRSWQNGFESHSLRFLHTYRGLGLLYPALFTKSVAVVQQISTEQSRYQAIKYTLRLSKRIARYPPDDNGMIAAGLPGPDFISVCASSEEGRIKLQGQIQDKKMSTPNPF